MTQKWNLQDIRPAERKKRSSAGEDPVVSKRPVESSREDAEDTMSIDIVDGNKHKSKTLILAIVIFLVIVGGGFTASALMGGADVTVYPRHREPNVNATFTALRTPQTGELSYEIMTLEAEGERQVEATGQENVQEQAEGTILIYNKHQTNTVRLVTNTRFQTSDGLIFKIKDSAVIPGYTKDDAGQIIPGVLSAEVFAEAPGEQYNVPPGKFTIPGFEGDPEFETIYAESMQNMTGGFDGQRFIIEESELQTAQQGLRMELRNALLDRIASERPAGFVLFDDSVTFTYESLPSVEYGQNLATIKEKVLLRIPLFKEEAFASYIAAATVPGYEGLTVRIDNYDQLQFKYSQATTSATDIGSVEALSFSIVGKPLIVWTFDEAKLKSELLNVSKTALPALLSDYPAIERAEAVIRPFWKTKFPIEMTKIDIIEKLGTD